MNRENDIMLLAKGVMKIAPTYEENYNSRQPSYYECPFCGAEEYENRCKEGEVMKSIKHELECPYLIAKDLLTNIT